jgi:CRISPR-associated protein Cas1
MTDRILDISDNPARLSRSLDRLLIERNGAPSVAIPLEDIAVLVLGHPQITCSEPALAGIVERGGAVIACDGRRRPVGMMLSLVSHSTQTARIAAQANAKASTNKRLWRAIVRAKISAQAGVLAELTGADGGLAAMARRVRSGDPTNVEAQAAQRYWPRLFADKSFRRRPTRQDENALLNYGYAVLRAAVGRAICAAGLHPSLGLHHRNKYNAFCLADDLVEPLRPLVDRCVVGLLGERKGDDVVLDRPTKAALVGIVTARYELEGEERSFFDHIARLATSLAKVYCKEELDLWIPTLWNAPRRT